MNRILTQRNYGATATYWEVGQSRITAGVGAGHQVNVGTVSKALANRSDLTSPKILAALGVGRCIR